VFQAEEPGVPVERWAATVASKIYDEAFLMRVAQAKTLDFMGVNYYTRIIIGFTPAFPFVGIVKGNGTYTPMGMEIYPKGIYLTAKAAWEKYGLPIMFTENGLDDPLDEWRPQFLRDHFSWLRRARDEGIPLLGYLHWSLTDNFEWTDGLTPRFGLVAINYTNLQRTPRPSYFVYKQLIKNWSLSSHL